MFASLYQRLFGRRERADGAASSGPDTGTTISAREGNTVRTDAALGQGQPHLVRHLQNAVPSTWPAGKLLFHGCTDNS